MRSNGKKQGVHLLPSDSDALTIAEELTKTQEEAFFVCDLSDVVHKYAYWKKMMPRIEPHYAVKTNDYVSMLKTLAALGTGFDCASKSEIQKVLAVGVEPERIIYANPTKDAAYIKYAAENGVDLMTFDSEEELYKTKQIFPKARLIIRLKCESQKGIRSMSQKHGCEPKYIRSLLKLAHDLGLNVMGVSFHVGCEIHDFNLYRKAIAACRQVFDEAAQVGFKLSLVDIGGGFQGATGTTIKPVADVINAALDDFFPDPNVRIISEPGRFYANSAFTLATKIHSMNNVNASFPEKEPNFMYFINDSVYSNFNFALSERRLYLPEHPKGFDDKPSYVSSIWGQTCDPMDVVTRETYLPKLSIGDWLTWCNMGAYTLAMANNFNGFPKAKIFDIADIKHKMLLKDHFSLQYYRK